MLSFPRFIRFGRRYLSTYKVCLSLGIYSGVIIAATVAKQNGINPISMALASLASAAVGLIGGRAYHLILFRSENRGGQSSGEAWDTSQGGRFTVVLQVSALDRAGLLRDLSESLSDSGVMILSSSSWAKRDGTARLRFAFELADMGHLDHIQKTVRRVEGVFDSYRVLPLKAREG